MPGVAAFAVLSATGRINTTATLRSEALGYPRGASSLGTSVAPQAVANVNGQGSPQTFLDGTIWTDGTYWIDD